MPGTVSFMAKKAAANSDQPMDHLNALIPADLKRRMLIVKANSRKTITELLVEWIEEGLAKAEKVKGK